MASKKEFKKDVNFLTNEIVMRGIIHLEFFGRDNAQEVYEIMNEAVKVRNDYIVRINQRFKKKVGNNVKNHFKSLYDDLLSSTHDLLQKIDELKIPV
jgi:hypothetical protein